MLKPVLKLPQVVFFVIGITIGGGIFTFTGIVVKIAGPALPLAYALAAIPVFLSLLPLLMLGSAIPVTGGNYKYPSRMVSPALAFTGIWVFALSSFFGQIPLYAITCANYLNFLLPGIPINLFAIGFLTFLFLINLFGVKLAIQLQIIMVILLLSALFIYMGNGITHLKTENFESFFQQGSSNIILGTALLTFTYMGANSIIELGGEINNAGKVIPRSVFIAFPLITVIYILVAYVTVGVTSWKDLVNVSEPLVTVSRSILGKSGVIFFITAGAILALTTTLNALFIIGTKSLLMIVEDNIFPRCLGKISSRFSSPYVLLTIIWLFSVLGVISGFSLETLASYSALGGMIIFFPVLMAALLLPKLYPAAYNKASFKLKGPWLYICTFIGFLMIVFFSIILFVNLASFTKIALFFLFIISGFVFYKARILFLFKKGIIVKLKKLSE